MAIFKDYYDFVKPGFVSVWVGDFRSGYEFDRYLWDYFPSDFGFEIIERAVHEAGVEPEPVKISKLVEGFSQWKTFAADLVKVAEARRISQASSMFILYNIKYDPSCQLVPNPTIQFLGAVHFPGFS